MKLLTNADFEPDLSLAQSYISKEEETSDYSICSKKFQ